MNLVSHPYCIVLDIIQGEIYAKRQKKKSRIVNVYDNILGKRQTWQDLEQKIRQTTQDVLWLPIIKQQMLIVGDMNMHGLMWNPHCNMRRNAKLLKEFIEKYKLW